MRSVVAKSFRRIMPRVMIGVLFMLEVAWILFLVYAFVRFALPADGRTSYLGPGPPRGNSSGFPMVLAHEPRPPRRARSSYIRQRRRSLDSHRHVPGLEKVPSPRCLMTSIGNERANAISECEPNN